MKTLHKGGSGSTHDTTSDIGIIVAVVIHKRSCHNTLRANEWVSTKLKVIEPAIAIAGFFAYSSNGVSSSSRAYSSNGCLSSHGCLYSQMLFFLFPLLKDACLVADACLVTDACLVIGLAQPLLGTEPLIYSSKTYGFA